MHYEHGNAVPETGFVTEHAELAIPLYKSLGINHQEGQLILSQVWGILGGGGGGRFDVLGMALLRAAI